MLPTLTPPASTEAPAAQRAATPRWRDARLWVGVALVAVSVVVGARVVGGADQTVPMWAVADDLPEGAEVGPSDLVARRVRFADPQDAALYFGTRDQLPADRFLARGMSAGELLPRGVLGAQDEDAPQVSVSVPAAQLPPAVAAGSVVDVWVLPPTGSSGSAKARLAVGEVRVVDAPRASAELGSVGSDRQLVLSIPDDGADLARVLTASGEGRLMIVGRG